MLIRTDALDKVDSGGEEHVEYTPMIDRKSVCSLISTEEMHKAVEEAFQHMDAAISSADFRPAPKRTAFVPSKSSSVTSLIIQGNKNYDIKSSDDSGKVRISINDLPYQNGNLDENWPSNLPCPKIRLTKIDKSTSSPATLRPLCTGRENMTTPRDEKMNFSGRQPTVIVSNYNCPRNCVERSEYTGKIPVKSFEDEYYAKEIDDDYLHMIQFGYRDLDSKGLTDASPVNRSSVPFQSTTSASLGYRTPQPQRKNRVVTMGNRSCRISSDTGEKCKISDFYKSKHDTKVSKPVEKSKKAAASETDDGKDDSNIIYSTVKQKLFEKECEKLECLLGEWNQKTRISKLVPKRGSEISANDMTKIEHLKKALLEQHELVQKLCPSKMLSKLPPDFTQRSPGVDERERIVPVQRSTVIVGELETFDRLERPSLANVYKASPYQAQRRSFYSEFSRGKSPPGRNKYWCNQQPEKFFKNDEQETRSSFSLSSEIPASRAFAFPSTFSSKLADKADISSTTSTQSKISEEIEKSRSSLIGDQSFAHQTTVGDIRNNSDLLSCSSIRRLNFRQPLTSFALMQRINDPQRTTDKWQSDTAAHKRLADTLSLPSQSQLSIDEKCWSLDNKPNIESVYRRQYEKIERITSSNKSPLSNDCNSIIPRAGYGGTSMISPFMSNRSHSQENLNLAEYGTPKKFD